MEFGFIVPKSVIYEALTHPMYFDSHSGRSCSTLEHLLRYSLRKEDNLSFLMVVLEANF
jgi:hypothetical protein